MDIRKTVRLYATDDGRTRQYILQRDVNDAINEKIKVLKDFYIVDKRNEEAVRAQMKAEIERRSDVDFDRVLDTFAKKLIDKKLGE